MKKHLTYLLLLINYVSYAQSTKQQIVDSIDYYIEATKDESLSLEERLTFGEKAFTMAKIQKNDSLILASRRKITSVYIFFDDYEMTYKLGHENLKLATKLKDTIAIAGANLTLGWYYDMKRVQSDSAYYYYLQSLQLYRQLDDKDCLDCQLTALNNMAKILLSERDYLGSERLIYEALSLTERLPKDEYYYDNLWHLFNSLGSIAREIGGCKKSKEWDQKAIETSLKTTYESYNKAISLNNLAEDYKELKNYAKAIEIYQDLLVQKVDYEEDDPAFYGLILSNLAETKFLAEDEDISEIKKMFTQAYKLTDSLKDPLAKMGVTYQTAKFHFNQQEQDSSLKYTKEAMSLAKQIKENGFVLDMLLQLSKLETGDKSKAHLYEYITLSDSLLVKERNARNKFARIQFETDQLEEANVKIGKERSLFLYLFVGSILSLGLLSIIILQRNKNKVLKYEAEQQEYSQELYELMLAQQQQLEKGRTQERIRVAEELHDGILGKLFGARMNLGFLKVDPNTKGEFDTCVQELQHIEKDIRTLSHELKHDAIPLDINYLDLINELVASYKRLMPFDVKLSIANTMDWTAIDEGVKLQTYRILQEALTNIIKHSEATEVIIDFKNNSNTLELNISDNGKGFNNSTTKGIGIKNMQSRAKRLKGRFSMESVPGKGSSIMVYLPLKKT